MCVKVLNMRMCICTYILVLIFFMYSQSDANVYVHVPDGIICQAWWLQFYLIEGEGGDYMAELATDACIVLIEVKHHFISSTNLRHPQYEGGISHSIFGEVHWLRTNN